MDIRSDNISVAGCGSMGLPMAQVLLHAGFKISGYDVRPLSEFAGFAENMSDDPAVISNSRVMISVVRDERQTLDLCFDEQAVFRNKDFPSIFIVSSTLSPRFVKCLADKLPQNVRLIDAPMSGAPVAAEQGKLSFMLGGDKATLDYLMPLFNTLGRRVFYCGDVGAGMTYKVLNNYVAAGSVVAVRRAFEIAGILNVDIDKLREVMSESSGANWFSDRFDEIAWARQGYDPGNTIGILEKDVASALDSVANLPEYKGSSLDRIIIDALRALKPYEN